VNDSATAVQYVDQSLHGSLLPFLGRIVAAAYPSHSSEEAV
jgi:hypothetical protein